MAAADLLDQQVTLDFVFVVGNLPFTARAVWFNTKLYRAGFREQRWVAGWRAFFASCYFMSYLVLAFTGVDRVFWSHVMVGFSWPVWEICWVQPAKQANELREKMVEAGVASITRKRAA